MCITIYTHKFYLKQFKLSILTEAQPRSDVLLLLIHSFHMCKFEQKHLCFIVVLTHYTRAVVTYPCLGMKTNKELICMYLFLGLIRGNILIG